jgi:hypothetical protein
MTSVAERADDLMRAGLSQADAAHFAALGEAEVCLALKRAEVAMAQRTADLADMAVTAGARLAGLSRAPRWLLDALAEIAFKASQGVMLLTDAAPSAPAPMTIKALAWQPNPAGQMAVRGCAGFYAVTPQKVGRARLVFFEDGEPFRQDIGEIDGDADMRRIGQEHHERRIRKFLEGAAK